MMTRNFKALGLALVAMLALGAVVASSASAAFEAESTPVRVTRSANNTQIFTYNEGIAVQCTTVGGSGEQTVSPNTDFRFNPTYSGCTVPAIAGTATVSMNGCGYTFTSNTGSTSMRTETHPTHLVCPAGSTVTITITVPFLGDICTLHLGSQTVGGTITGSRTGSGTTREVKIASNVTGIVGSRTGSSTCGPATSTTGTYSGEVTATGENPSTGAHIGIFMD